MAKCPACNQNISFFSQNLWGPRLPSPEMYTFMCSNCKRKLGITTKSALICMAITAVSFIFVAKSFYFIPGITAIGALLCLITVALLNLWFHWRYIIRFRTKDTPDNFKSFRFYQFK